MQKEQEVAIEQFVKNLEKETPEMKALINRSVIAGRITQGETPERLVNDFQELMGFDGARLLVKAAYASLTEGIGPGALASLYAHPAVLARPDDIYSYKVAFDDISSEATSAGVRGPSVKNEMRLPGIQPSDFSPKFQQPLIVTGDDVTVLNDIQGRFYSDSRALAKLLNREDADYRDIGLRSYNHTSTGSLTFVPTAGMSLIGYVFRFTRKTNFKDRIAASVNGSFGSVAFQTTSDICHVVGFYFKRCQNASPSYALTGTTVAVGLNTTEDGSWAQDIATDDADPDHTIGVTLSSDGTSVDYFPLYAENPKHRQFAIEALTWGGDADSLYDQEIIKMTKA